MRFFNSSIYTQIQVQLYMLFFVVECSKEGPAHADLGTEQSWEILKQSLDGIGYFLFDLNRNFITHHHRDHICLLHRILSHKEVPIYAHPHAIPRLKRDQEKVELYESNRVQIIRISRLKSYNYLQ